MWYGNGSNQDRKALQRVVRLAERISGSALRSLQDIYLKRCKSRAAKIIKDSNNPGNRLFILLPSGKRFRSMMAKTERLRRSFLPPSHQAPKLKLSLITSTWVHLIISKIFIILHHPYCCYVNTLYNLFAHSSCTFLLLLLFIKSTVYCPAHFILLHICLFLFLFFTFFIPIFMYILLCLLHIIALSMERTWLAFHCWLYFVLLCMWRIKSWKSWMLVACK